MNFYFSQLLVPLVSCIRKYLLVITVLVIHPQIFFGILNRNVRYGDFIFNRSTLFRIKGKISTGLGSSDLFSVFSDAISFPGSIFFCLVIKLSGKKYPVIGELGMNMIAVKVDSSVKKSDEAVMLGEGITLGMFSRSADMGLGESLMNVGKNNPRVYIKKGE